MEEILPLLIPDRSLVAEIADGLAAGFQYLEDRLLGNCQAAYSPVNQWRRSSTWSAPLTLASTVLCPRG